MPTPPPPVKTRFKPGQSGNPKGRARGTSFKQRQLGFAMEVLSDEAFTSSYIKAFRTHASKGDSWQARLLADRIFQTDIFEQIDAWIDRGERQERDFLSYQLHKRATDVQRQMLFTRERYLFLMAGRRAGKSTGLRDWFLDALVQKADARCLYVGLTIHKAMDLLWQPIVDGLAELGIKLKEQRRTDGELVTEGGGVMKFGGNTSKDEREKNRGPYWDRVAIDEAQSQKELLYLIETILAPTLIDTQGQMAVTGTGPRVRGTYWEALFLGQWADGRPLYSKAMRLNFNVTDNPYIKNHDKVLAEIRAEKTLSENDPLYIREYLGRIAYDDDALVLRLGDANWLEEAALTAWLKAGPGNVRFEGGLDLGFEDADAFCIVCYSLERPERWLIYEYKARRTGTDELDAAVRKGLEYLRTSPLFKECQAKDSCLIYTDTGGGGKKTGYDLSLKGLPIQDAYKANKDMAIELLQAEIRTGMFKVRRDGPLAEEAQRTVFARDDQDNLTRVVDDETYHPDMMPAVTYAMRPIWMFQRRGE